MNSNVVNTIVGYSFLSRNELYFSLDKRDPNLASLAFFKIRIALFLSVSAAMAMIVESTHSFPGKLG